MSTKKFEIPFDKCYQEGSGYSCYDYDEGVTIKYDFTKVNDNYAIIDYNNYKTPGITNVVSGTSSTFNGMYGLVEAYDGTGASMMNSCEVDGLMAYNNTSGTVTYVIKLDCNASYSDIFSKGSGTLSATPANKNEFSIDSVNDHVVEMTGHSTWMNDYKFIFKKITDSYDDARNHEDLF